MNVAESAAQLYAHGDHAFKRGQWLPALAAFGGVVEACAGHLKSRLRIADALLNAGKRELALDVYKAIALRASDAGQPLVALVATKMVLLLDPSAEDTVGAIADRYSRDSDHVDALHEGPAPVVPGTERAAALQSDGDALIQEAARLAMRGDTAQPRPRTVPPIPLLSSLDEDAFAAVVGKIRLRRFADEEVIIREGERGESFFIVADGDVLVKRDIEDEDGGITLAHLHRGAVFGEMALIADDPRQASVIAQGDVEVLEMRRSDLIVAAAHVEGVSEALKSFTRERFLRNLTATHPFFAGLMRDERHEVMESFRIVTFRRGDTVIEEGQEGAGLFLLLGGSASVAKVTGNERIHLATLRGADVCGEMSVVTDTPTQATVMCEDDLEALFLSRASFKAVVRAHPELIKYLASLTDERQRHNRALLHGRGLLEDDEHVMI